MKRANSKLAALTLITTLAVTSVIGTTVHADVQEKVDQAVSRGYSPITEKSLEKVLQGHNLNNFAINGVFPKNNNFKNNGINITGTVKTFPKSSESPSWFWNLWNRFKTFVKNIFS
ncbi:TPA: hypothetical protein U1250_000584 [Streptococcus suis]|nr:hypothetical protein [Streptococcus suis]